MPVSTGFSFEDVLPLCWVFQNRRHQKGDTTFLSYKEYFEETYFPADKAPAGAVI